jgi:predicted Rossmann fold nucleotide-binding protein DprA/Smf involved in DNA uptake
MNQLNIFNRYPDSPGYKKSGTSKQAAKDISSKAKTLRQAVLEQLRIKPATTDEVAAALSESVLSIRPRFSELKLSGLITESPERRKNDSGKWATVWKVI